MIVRQVATRRGTSVIEALIAVGIISLILTLAVAIFIQTVNHAGKTFTDLAAESEARIAMTKVTNDLRQAMPIEGQGGLPVSSPAVPSGGGSATPAAAVTFTEANSLTAANFTNPPFDTVTIAWDPAKNTITRTVNGGNAQVVEHDVTAFSVLPLNFDEYQVSLTVAPKHRGEISSPPFSLVSSIFISYYKTSASSPGVL